MDGEVCHVRGHQRQDSLLLCCHLRKVTMWAARVCAATNEGGCAMLSVFSFFACEAGLLLLYCEPNPLPLIVYHGLLRIQLSYHILVMPFFSFQKFTPLVALLSVFLLHLVHRSLNNFYKSPHLFICHNFLLHLWIPKARAIHILVIPSVFLGYQVLVKCILSDGVHYSSDIHFLHAA